MYSIWWLHRCDGLFPPQWVKGPGGFRTWDEAWAHWRKSGIQCVVAIRPEPWTIKREMGRIKMGIERMGVARVPLADLEGTEPFELTVEVKLETICREEGWNFRIRLEDQMVDIWGASRVRTFERGICKKIEERREPTEQRKGSIRQRH